MVFSSRSVPGPFPEKFKAKRSVTFRDIHTYLPQGTYNFITKGEQKTERKFLKFSETHPVSILLHLSLKMINLKFIFNYFSTGIICRRV